MARKRKIEDIDARLLSKDEMHKMELNHAKEEARRLRERVAEMSVLMKQYEQELLKKEVESLKSELNVVKQKNEAERLEHRIFVKDIKDKHKLGERWGFNPDTGEIIDG